MYIINLFSTIFYESAEGKGHHQYRDFGCFRRKSDIRYGEGDGTFCVSAENYASS